MGFFLEADKLIFNRNRPVSVPNFCFFKRKKQKIFTTPGLQRPLAVLNKIFLKVVI